MQKDSGVLAARKGDIDHAVPVFVPFPNAKLCFEDLRLQRQVLHLCQLP